MTHDAPGLRGPLLAQLEALAGWDDAMKQVAVAVLQAATAEEFYDAERGVAALLRERADAVVAAILAYRATAPEFVEPARRRAHEAARKQGVQLVSNGRRKTRVQLLGGLLVTLVTLRMRPVQRPRPGRKRGVGRRGPGGTGFYPVLAELGVTGLATPALMAEVAREVAESTSVEVARASLRERGLDIQHKTALRLTYHFADRALALRKRAMETVAPLAPFASKALAGRRVVVGVDGGRLRVRHNPKAGRRNAKTRHRRYKAPWKEPKIVSIYTVTKDGKRDKSFQVVLDGTMGDADDAFALLIGHLRLRGAHDAEHLTLVSDGAEWIWGRAQLLREAVGLPPEKFTEVVDYFHATEHLHETAEIPKNWTPEDKSKWLKRTERHLRAGRTGRVIEAIQSLRVGRRGKEIGKRLHYFKQHQHRMRYADFRAHGAPIGSGAVESAVRRVVNLRMKGNSIFWLPEHAEAMLHLRAYLKAGRWDELARATIEQPVWSPP